MLSFIARRSLIGLSTIVFISIFSFIIIQLPEGDYIDTWYAAVSESGGYAYSIGIGLDELEKLRRHYGLDKPLYQQYLKWVYNLIRGQFGFTLEYQVPVSLIIREKMLLTVVLAGVTVIFTWLLAIPIGIYSAVRQYSVGDYTFTLLGFIGLAVPDFLLALVLMYLAFQYFDLSIGGLFSGDFADAPWSAARMVDMLSHLWIPAVVLGTSGTAALMRIMRANVLDELHRPYVVTARAKGMTEFRTILKYPVRVALNPFISTIGYVFPYLISGSVIVSVVLSLPTIGPELLRSLLAQDMQLAATILMMVGIMTVLGTLLSDILLMLSDPRIRIQT